MGLNRDLDDGSRRFCINGITMRRHLFARRTARSQLFQCIFGGGTLVHDSSDGFHNSAWIRMIPDVAAKHHAGGSSSYCGFDHLQQREFVDNAPAKNQYWPVTV